MGATFENLYIRTRQSETLTEALQDIMKKRGYTRISNEDAADFCVSVHAPKTGKWCFVSSDNETPGFLKRMGKTLAALAETEVLFAACNDSDLLKTSLFIPGGGCVELKIDVSHPAPPPTDAVAAIWKRILTDPAVFTRAATAKYTFAEEFLFSAAPLIDLSTENMLYWEPDDDATTVLCFAKKTKSGNEKQSVAAMLGTALKKEGFQKLPHGFYKPLNKDMGLCVAVEREKHASYSETKHGLSYMHGTDKTAYDLRVCITNEVAVRTGHFLGIQLSLIAALPKKQLIADFECTAPEIAAILLRAFYEYAFDPLFRNNKPIPSVFDTMCLWELHAFGTVDYKCYYKALAAYREGRTWQALLCLKWLFYPFFHRNPTEWSEYNIRLLSDKEINTLRDSEYGERLKNCFALYDKLQEPYPFKVT